MKLSPQATNQLLDAAREAVRLLARAADILLDQQKRSVPQLNNPNSRYSRGTAPWSGGPLTDRDAAPGDLDF